MTPIMNVRRSICLIFLAALGFQLILGLAIPPLPPGSHDSTSWEAVGRSLAAGLGFVEDGRAITVRPPGYPFFLSIFYRISEDGGNDLARWVQVLLSCATSVLIFMIGLNVFDGKTAFWGGILSGLLPSGAVYSRFIASESFFTFLMVLCLHQLVSGQESRSLKKYSVSGILMGISNLSRSVLSFFPFFLIAAALALKRNRKEISGIFLASAVSFLVIAPWTLRNYKVLGGFLLVNVGAGQALWLGSQQETGGRYVGSSHPSYRQFDPLLQDAIGWERASMAVAVRNARSDILGYARLTAKKFVLQWFEPIGGQIVRQKSGSLFYLLTLLNAGFVLLAFWGMGESWAIKERAYPLLAIIIYYGVTHLLIFPLARFRMPFEPVLALFAVHGLLNLKERVRRA